ncbi:MAG: ZIP family metal transporter [Erysipelotrichaceae bacterium]|nr:ZIP family metal transporter [Erysipelotrichaceae bacterium]
MEWFLECSPVLQALMASMITWGVTALGALIVCFFRNINQKVLDTLLGFSAGVMIAASFWSLLSPSIELSKQLGYIEWLCPALGFLAGGIFVVLADLFLDKTLEKKNNIKTSSMKRSILLVLAVTLHNIPEGMAVGVAFGGVGNNIPGASIISALLLTLGIAMQNFPEGAAVSLPLRREGYNRKKSFFYGQASGIVEPIAAVIGAVAAICIQSILPFLLAFSAGAMIGVVSAELIPESIKNSKNLASLGIIIGFITMMILDVALG